jgi:hypothetical protein
MLWSKNCEVLYYVTNSFVWHGNWFSIPKAHTRWLKILKGSLTWEGMVKISWKISAPLSFRWACRLIALLNKFNLAGLEDSSKFGIFPSYHTRHITFKVGPRTKMWFRFRFSIQSWVHNLPRNDTKWRLQITRNTIIVSCWLWLSRSSQLFCFSNGCYSAIIDKYFDEARYPKHFACFAVSPHRGDKGF